MFLFRNTTADPIHGLEPLYHDHRIMMHFDHRNHVGSFKSKLAEEI